LEQTEALNKQLELMKSQSIQFSTHPLSAAPIISLSEAPSLSAEPITSAAASSAADVDCLITISGITPMDSSISAAAADISATDVGVSATDVDVFVTDAVIRATDAGISVTDSDISVTDAVISATDAGIPTAGAFISATDANVGSRDALSSDVATPDNTPVTGEDIEALDAYKTLLPSPIDPPMVGVLEVSFRVSFLFEFFVKHYIR
jgi:hypothetical protein